MDTARRMLAVLIHRKRAAARAVARAKRENFSEQTLLLFEAQQVEASTSFLIARSIYRAGRSRELSLRRLRLRIIAMTQTRGEFVTLEDGYTHYWPQGSIRGAFTAWHLRTLADELDRRNKPWDAHLRKVFRG